ncbi:MAG: fluoride efflux transporter CrcB [Bacteroidota bacterium]
MIKFFVVFIGGGLGSVFRYWISSYASKHLPLFFPFGTLLVNIIGSFILGLMIFGWDEKGLISPTIKLFIGVGFCGGLTTFSTFSLETFNLIKDAEFLMACLNIAVNVLFTLIGIYIAYLVTR